MCARKKGRIKVELKLTVPEKAENENTHQSPLANAYNPIYPFLMPQQSYRYVHHTRITQCLTVGLEGDSISGNLEEIVLFCDMPGHSIRECKKKNENG